PSLTPFSKTGVQVAAIALALWAGLRVEVIGNDIVACGLAALWLLAITNAFNLLDNMDGLAGTLGLIAATFFAIDSVTVHKERLLLVLALAIGCACLGFLPFNFRIGRPAAVFMGDSGSQVLGFGLADLGQGAAHAPSSGPLLLRTILLRRRRLVEALVDFALVTASFTAAYLLVVGGHGTVAQRHVFLVSLPAILAARYLAFIPAGL